MKSFLYPPFIFIAVFCVSNVVLATETTAQKYPYILKTETTYQSCQGSKCTQETGYLVAHCSNSAACQSNATNMKGRAYEVVYGANDQLVSSSHYDAAGTLRELRQYTTTSQGQAYPSSTTVYSATGVKVSVLTYKNGYKSEQTTYLPNGDKSSKEVYADGSKHLIINYANNKITSITTYDPTTGKEWGEEVYNSDGQLISKTENEYLTFTNHEKVITYANNKVKNVTYTNYDNTMTPPQPTLIVVENSKKQRLSKTSITYNVSGQKTSSTVTTYSPTTGKPVGKPVVTKFTPPAAKNTKSMLLNQNVEKTISIKKTAVQSADVDKKVSDYMTTNKSSGMGQILSNNHP